MYEIAFNPWSISGPAQTLKTWHTTQCSSVSNPPTCSRLCTVSTCQNDTSVKHHLGLINHDNNCCFETALGYITHFLRKQNSKKNKNKKKQQALHMLNTSSMEGEAGAEMTRQFKCSTVRGRPGLWCSRANRIGTLRGPGRRLASFGRDAGGSSTGGGGGPECCPERTSGGYFVLWRSAGAAGLPAVPLAALRKKRQNVEEQGGGWEWVDNGHDKTVWRRDWSYKCIYSRRALRVKGYKVVYRSAQ